MVGRNKAENARLGLRGDVKPLLWFGKGTGPGSEKAGSVADIHSGSHTCGQGWDSATVNRSWSQI